MADIKQKLIDLSELESVWYCPKLDLMRLASKNAGYLFKNRHGEFHWCYSLMPLDFEQMYEFYYIGEL